MGVNGWTGADLWAFEQLLIKANDEQLKKAIQAIHGHIGQRKRAELERFVKLVNEVSHGRN